MTLFPYLNATLFPLKSFKGVVKQDTINLKGPVAYLGKNKVRFLTQGSYKKIYCTQIKDGYLVFSLHIENVVI